MWRPALPEDSKAIIALCENLYAEDPADNPHAPKPVIAVTLTELFRNPQRGKAVVLQHGEVIGGFALLVAFWSNEFGGEIVIVDELYVVPACRRQGHATQLFSTLRTPGNLLWPNPPAAIFLEAHATNSHAQRFYKNLGFKQVHNLNFILSLE